jgi:undecaprenyl-diphosphatase
MREEVSRGAAGIGIVGAGVIAFLVTLTVLAVWAARHPVSLRRMLSVFEPLRFARLDAALARMSGRLGISLLALAVGIVGLAAVGLLAVGFTDLLEDVLNGGGLAQFDGPLVHWIAGHREAWLTNVLVVLTLLGNTGAQTIVITAVALLAAVVVRSWLPVAVAVAGGGGIALVIWAAKHLVSRQRPPLADALIVPGGFSFPSGHATGAAAVGALCAWMSTRWVVGRWGVQVGVWAVTVALIVLIGFSRVYLAVHYPTDVLAGWFLGAAWAGVVILLAEWWSTTTRRWSMRRGDHSLMVNGNH